MKGEWWRERCQWAFSRSLNECDQCHSSSRLVQLMILLTQSHPLIASAALFTAASPRVGSLATCVDLTNSPPFSPEVP